MKINFNSYFNPPGVSPTNTKTVARQAKGVPAQRNRSCDEIIISSRSSDSISTSFAEELKSKISQEVRTATSEEKLADIRQQVQSGTYQIDIDEIAKNMLLH